MVALVTAVSGCRGGSTSPSATAPYTSGPPAPTAVGGTTPNPGASGAGTPLPGGGQQAGAYFVSFSGAPNPAVRGANTLQIVVTDASGQPVSDAKVTLDLSMTNMNMGKYVVVAAPAGNGRYSGNVSYSMGGPWRVTVVVERAGQAAGSTHFDFSVR
jgi:hypothetical protein